MERDYYLPGEILPLVLNAGKTKSSFYRAYREGKIFKVIRDEREVYDREVVDKFLRGEFEKAKGPRKTRGVQPTAAIVADTKTMPPISIVRMEDTAALYMMETAVLPRFEDALVPPTIQGWIGRNKYVYWAEFHPHNRRDIWAVLGILPLPEEVIVQLLQKEISPKDIPVEAVLPYEPGKIYSCYISSTTAVRDHSNAITRLMQRVLSYWKKHNICVERVYIDVPEESLEDIPPLILTNEFFYSPLYGLDERRHSTHWVLRLDRRNGNPSVKAYQQSIEQQKKEKTHMLAAIPVDTLPADTISQMKLSPRNFTDLKDRFHSLGPDGYITKHARFRRALSHDDILAIIEINNALFPPSSGSAAQRFLPILQAWWNKNPDVFQVLEVDNEIVGFASFLPLSQDIIDKIVRNDLRMTQIKGDDIQEYTPEQPTNIFVWTVAVHPDIQGQRKRSYGWYLALGMWNFLNDLGARGVDIGAIYARSDEVEGINLSFGFRFKPVPPPPGVKKLVFCLDFAEPNEFLADYKLAFTNYRTVQTVKSSHGQ